MATSYGALDVSELTTTQSTYDLAIVPIFPSEPIVVSNHVAALWTRLAARPVPAAELSAGERTLVAEFVVAGIASTDLNHPARTRGEISKPWLLSYAHELVYSLIASVARDSHMSTVFIKGPVLFAQGLRSRQHSGDVDVWVPPHRYVEFIELLERWGWQRAPELIRENFLSHSWTLFSPPWACEIDVHFRFPGMAASDEECFGAILRSSDSTEFANVEARVPSPPFHSVIEALHQLRPQPGRVVQHHHVSTAARALSIAGIDAVSASTELRANGVLLDALREAFPQAEVEKMPLPHDWRWRGSSTTARSYMTAVRGAAGVKRLLVLFRLVWPTPAAAISSARHAGSMTTSVTRARLERLMRGTRQVFGMKSR